MDIIVTGSAFEYLPIELVYGIFTNESGDVLCVIPKEFPFRGGWGKSATLTIEENNTIWPYAIDLVWLSVAEEKFYHYKGLFPNLPDDFYNESQSYITINIGMTSQGKIAFWTSNDSSCILLQWTSGEGINFNPSNFKSISKGNNLHEICANILNGIPSDSDWGKLIARRMIRYSYRYYIDFLNNSDYNESNYSQLDYIKVERFDSTYDKKCSEVLLNYHFAGKPSKICIIWRHNNSQYKGFFWMNEQQTSAIYDKFYGIHNEIKSDFIIRIDAENKKYELALYRQGLREPVVIPESAYQLIVFKNKFEDFRSENYNQPRGAWIW